MVASNIPFVTSTSQTTVSTLTSIERKDVGIICASPRRSVRGTK